MANINWSLTAEEDLREIELYIARDSIIFAVQFVDSLIEITQHLILSPQLGRVVPELNQNNIREIIHRNYRIVYLIFEDEITILRVLNSSRDFNGIELF